jgi:glucokinase
MILAGDIGGTSTRLALFDDALSPRALEVYRSGGHRGLEEMVRCFLTAHPEPVDRAAFGVAGPVRNGNVEATNLAWPVVGSDLADALGLDRVDLLNDLEANAYGIDALGPDDVAVLNDATPDPAGNVAVISAGTGLGEAMVVRVGNHVHVVASEGGHSDFAPRNELEIGLLRFLAAEHGHVSYERVCSGMGLANVYRYLTGEEADPAEVSRAALEDGDETALRALDLMVSIYGAQAGNLALTLLATGGVYLGGGIPPKILPRLEAGGFMAAFRSKGRFSAFLERVPVRVILNDRTALVGAALYASRRGAPADGREPAAVGA